MKAPRGLSRRHFGALAAGALGAVAPRIPLAAEPAHATPAWPRRALRLIVVYPTGGVSDATARLLARQLEPALGMPVIVENRGGAGGSVGIDALARAAPDGHTLAFSAISPLTLHPLLARVAYDPEHGVLPVAGVMRTPVLVAGTPAFEGDGFEALIARAKAQPGAVRWATSGAATVGHLVLAQVRLQSGAAITHIPYQGGGRQLTDALAGQFEVLSTNVAGPQLDHVRRGAFKALAVGARSRLPALPQVPTLAELGYARANLDSLFGVYAPGGTPPAIVARLNALVRQALASDVMRRFLGSTYNAAFDGGVAQFAAEIAADRVLNRALVHGNAGVFD